MAFFHLFNNLSKIGFFYRFQSSFRPGDSTVMQLVYIVHKIYEFLKEGSEIRAVFLDISKAFDRVWHRGLIAKLRSIGVEGNLLNRLISYLSCRKQRVIIEGVHSDWCNIEAGVPQGSIRGPLLFLIYINDLPTTITSNCFVFADDCFLLEKVQSPGDCNSKLNHDLRSISDWAMNETKTKAIVFSAKRDKPVHPPLIFNNNIIEDVTVHEHLGLTLSSNLSWRALILKINQKASKKLNLLQPLKYNCYTLEVLFKSLVRSSLEFRCNRCFERNKQGISLKRTFLGRS